MQKIFKIAAVLLFLSACSSTSPVITANPDRANSTMGTTGSSPATNGVVPKSTDTLSSPKDTTLRTN